MIERLPLKAALLRLYGKDIRSVQRVLEFNKSLIKAKGRELLIDLTYTPEIQSSDSPLPTRIAHLRGCLLARLSGRSMHIQFEDGMPEIILPISYWVEENIGGDPSFLQRQPGPLMCANGFGSDPITFDALLYMITSSVWQTALKLRVNRIVASTILIGKEIDEYPDCEKIGYLRRRLAIAPKKKRLIGADF